MLLLVSDNAAHEHAARAKEKPFSLLTRFIPKTGANAKTAIVRVRQPLTAVHNKQKQSSWRRVSITAAFKRTSALSERHEVKIEIAACKAGNTEMERLRANILITGQDKPYKRNTG